MYKINKTEAEWKSELTEMQYYVLRQKGTERPFTGAFTDTETEGTYSCAACGTDLFDASQKFHSGCGWASFWSELETAKIEQKRDATHGMVRVELLCSSCGGHLGHVFNDGPRDKTGLRYCINSASLDFREK